MKDVTVYCDGGSRGNPGPGAAAFVIINDGKVVAQDGVYLGPTTNNQAEYQAVVFALSFLEKNFAQRFKGVQQIKFFLDSELVVNQLIGRFKIRDKKLQPLAMVIKLKEQKLKIPITYQAIPREKNRLADFLVNKTLDHNFN